MFVERMPKYTIEPRRGDMCGAAPTGLEIWSTRVLQTFRPYGPGIHQIVLTLIERFRE